MRSPSAAEGGAASSAVGSLVSAPVEASAASRRSASANSSCEGATPTTPANGAPGIATPGTCSERAIPSRSSQWARKGSVNRSPRKPEPGQMPVHPKSSVL